MRKHGRRSGRAAGMVEQFLFDTVRLLTEPLDLQTIRDFLSPREP